MVDYEVKAGELSVRINCDSSELDTALAKLDLLVAKASKANELGVLPVGMLAATIATQADARVVSRRNLLFWWRR